MSNSIFELEQQIMECWQVTDDIELITNHLVRELDIDAITSDTIVNKYSAAKELYEIKFDRMWKTFEKVCAERNGRFVANSYSENTQSYKDLQDSLTSLNADGNPGLGEDGEEL